MTNKEPEKPKRELEVVRGEIVGEEPLVPGLRKFTRRTKDAISKSMAEGLPLSTAAALAGVAPSTAQKWVERGLEMEEGPLYDFAIKIIKAKAGFQAEIVKGWIELARETKQWAGLATYLERTDPGNFRRPSEKAGDVNVNVVVGDFEKTLHTLAQKGKLEYDGG